MKRIFTLALIFCVPMIASAASTMYVQSVKASVMAAPKFKSQTVVILKRGDAVAVMEQQRGWYRIEVQGKPGWVSRLLLRANPPLKRVTYIKDDSDEIGAAARKRASTVTTAGATRGLATDARMRHSQNYVSDYNALDRMEEAAIEQAEVVAFSEGVK